MEDNNPKILLTSQFKNCLDMCEGILMGGLFLQFLCFLVGNFETELLSLLYNVLSFAATSTLRAKNH
jgi:hypothetical protein